MTFKGYEVLDWPVAVDTVDLTLTSKYNVIGDIWQKRQLHVQHEPYTLLQFTFFQDNAEQRYQLREFFKARKGRHEHFWVRSYKNDLKLLLDVTAGGTDLYCEQGYDLKAYLERELFIYIPGHGTIYTVLDISDGWDHSLDIPVSVIKISPPAPFLLEKYCTILEFCYFGRFDTDTLAFAYTDIWTSTATVPFREAAVIEQETYI